MAWCHPKFGLLLASCSSDRTVRIFEGSSKMSFRLIYSYTGHEASGSFLNLILVVVNGIAWAPPEYGLGLIAASSDGSISMHFPNSYYCFCFWN